MACAVREKMKHKTAGTGKNALQGRRKTKTRDLEMSCEWSERGAWKRGRNKADQIVLSQYRWSLVYMEHGTIG